MPPKPAIDATRRHGREASAGAVGEADKARHRPSQARPQRSVDVKGNRNKGKHGASGCSAPARKRLDPGQTLPVARNRDLLKRRGLGKLGLQLLSSFLRLRRICRPAFRGGFRILGVLVFGLAQMEPCAQRIPRAPRAWRNKFRPATGKVEIVAAPRRFGFCRRRQPFDRWESRFSPASTLLHRSPAWGGVG
jgi:hypothetical protein